MRFIKMAYRPCPASLTMVVYHQMVQESSSCSFYEARSLNWSSAHDEIPKQALMKEETFQ